MKLRASHYRRFNAQFWVNGCTLNIENGEVTAKSLCKRIVSFRLGEAKCKPYDESPFFKGIRIFDSENDYLFLFCTSKTRDMLVDLISKI